MSIYNIPNEETPITQGDIFINLPNWRPHRRTRSDPWPDTTQRGNIVLDLQTANFAILATQTCDTPKVKDFLFVSAITADELARELAEQPDNPISEQEFRQWIVKNLHPRFHFFERYQPNNEANVIIPELVANFRKPFTLRTNYVIEKLIPDGHRILSLQSIYSAEFGSRFGHFFARVATERNMESI